MITMTKAITKTMTKTLIIPTSASALVGILALASFQVAESLDNNTVETLETSENKPETPSKLLYKSPPSLTKGMANRLRHIDPLDENRGNATHRSKNPHRNLSVDQQISVALQHFQEGRKPQAIIVLTQTMEKFPTNAKLYDVRATIELQSGNTKEALSDLEKAVRLDANNPIYRVNRSQLYLKFHRQQEALKDLNKAIDINPDLIPARFNRGSLLAYQGKNEEAIKDFDQCIALNPHLPAPYFNRASVYHSLGKKDNAITDIENFIKIAKQENWKKSAKDLLKVWKEEKS